MCCVESSSITGMVEISRICSIMALVTSVAETAKLRGPLGVVTAAIKTSR